MIFSGFVTFYVNGRATNLSRIYRPSLACLDRFLPARFIHQTPSRQISSLLRPHRITGAASGFGLATTLLFVSEGCKVVAADLNAESLAKHFSSEATDVAGNTAHNVATVTGNVAQADTWATLVATAKEKFGGLDIVINNAGASYRNKPTEEVTEADFDKCFTVNVKSVYFSVGAVVPALEERGGGAIINIASIGATRPRPGLVWYNASKGAVANVSLCDPGGDEHLRADDSCRLPKVLRQSMVRNRSESTVCCLC